MLDHHAGKLSAKQQAFCREYLVDFNATQAAIRAGYSERSARSIGNENLTKPDIQKYLVALQKPVLEQFEVTQERVIQEIISLAFSNIFDFLENSTRLLEINDFIVIYILIRIKIVLDQVDSNISKISPFLEKIPAKIFLFSRGCLNSVHKILVFAFSISLCVFD